MKERAEGRLPFRDRLLDQRDHKPVNAARRAQKPQSNPDELDQVLELYRLDKSTYKPAHK